MKCYSKMVVSLVLVFSLIFTGMACSADTLADGASIRYMTALDTLQPINGGFDWNNEAPADPFGNDYSDVCNYFVYHGNYCGNGYRITAEYKIDRQYDVISMYISPFSDCGANGSSYV